MTLGIEDGAFTLEGRRTFLLGISYYGALGAPGDCVERDLQDFTRLGFNWVRVWATWGAFEPVSAVTLEGEPREPYLSRLQALCRLAERTGLAVDVTLSRGNGAVGVNLRAEQAAHLRAVRTVTEVLRPFRHLYFDLANEHNIRDRRHVSFEELRGLRDEVKALDSERLVTASHAGDIPPEELGRYVNEAGLDFVAPHRPRHPGSPGETEAATREYRRALEELSSAAPVHYQEPFRRGFGEWQPRADDFLADLRGALAGGAAGWCLHNGHQCDRPDGRPRRSFDMSRSEGRLLQQLDEEERQVLQQAGTVVAAGGSGR
ncbi:MAG: hypothetical protein HPY83_10235 [Anaerolineae bacterium]|nr:hypothetical protein [Anaerolineae bacterium]